MKKSHSFALMAAVVLTSLTGLTACSSSSDVEEVNNPNVVYDDQGTAGVKPEFVISFPNSVVGSKTRMTDSETQSLGTYDQFRGMDHIRLIPFKAEPTSSTEKLASIMALTSIQTLKKGGSLNYKVYADQFVPMLTTHFLFYGKAIDNAADVDISTSLSTVLSKRHICRMQSLPSLLTLLLVWSRLIPALSSRRETLWAVPLCS